jgi:phage shock protein A
MKKGLLTVLLASLVLVGCQNYDDQFDDLNAQISALKSQVDGLSSLSGQVSSLSGTISGLQAGISAAQASASSAAAAAGAIDLSGLSASLTALQAEVDAIETAIATTATAAEVAALQTSLTAVETDLADLLVSNNVYSTAITVNSAASMAAALALGNKVALMNAAVDITDSATISDTDIQTFIDRVKTTTAGFRYDSGSTTGYAPTFDEMVSATTFDIESAGPVSAKKLAAATVVTLVNTYTTKVTSLDLSAMTSVTTISSGTDGTETANNLTLSSATNIDLGALTMYNVASASDALTIAMKKGGTLDIGSLTGTEKTTGLEEPLSLTISGPASLSISKIADGTMAVSDVAALTVSGFYGTLDVNSGVETLTTTDTVTATLDGAVDVVTATLDFKYDWDPSLTTAQAAVADDLRNDGYLTDIAATGDWVATDLKTLTVTGELLDLYLDEANLETLSIDATMHDLTITGSTDLSSLTVATGSKIGNITMTASNNLSVADFNHTTNLNNKLGTAGTNVTAGTSTNSANKSVSLSVTNNTSLTKLHSTGDDVNTLTVTGNTALAELDFTGLADDGAETTASTGDVNVWGNALVATSASNTSDGDTNRADGLATDLGSFDDGTSGMDTLKAYLTHIAATAGSTAFVTFDTLSTETDTETAGTSTVTLNTTQAGDGSTTNEATVLKMTAAATSNATSGSTATKAKRAFTFAAAGGKLILDKGGIVIPASPATGLVMTGNNAVDAAAITVAANTDRATALGFTLTANDDGAASLQVSLQDYAGNNDQAIATGDRYTSNTLMAAASTSTAGQGGGIPIFSTDAADLFTFSVGSNSVQVSTAGYGSAATTITQIEAVILNAWALKYGDGGTASASALATLVGRGNGFINVYSRQTDSGGAGLAVAMSVTDVLNSTTVNSGTSSNIDFVIGATKDNNDNSTVGSTTFKGLIISIESDTAGSDLNAVSAVADESGAQSLAEITTAYRSAQGNTWAGELYAATDDNRTDVRSPEGAVDGTANTAAAATTFNRVSWLG